MANLNANISTVSEVVVYDEQTGEVIACIPLNNGETAILKNGIGFRLYNHGTEPVFIERPGMVTLAENTMVYKTI